jgi:putative secretion ATPase (PEP-CTERM system associated)
MYQRFYGLQEKPFNVTPDPRFLYLSPHHQEALAHLQYAIQERQGFVAIIGEVGTGKTTLVHAVLSRLGSKVSTAFLFSTRLTAKGLLRLMLADFGIDSKARTKDELLLELNQFLLQQYSRGIDSLLIVDEAQNLSSGLLEEIRMLSNLETDRDKLLQIVLVGQPELATKLALPQLRQLRQRIGCRYRIYPLDGHETGEYIRHRLKVAGLSEGSLFDQPAIDIIYRCSQGIPRLINVICDNILLLGYANGKSHIDVGLANEVVDDLKGQGVLPDLPGQSPKTSSPKTGAEERSSWWRQHVWRPLVAASGLLLGAALFSLPLLPRDLGEASAKSSDGGQTAASSFWNPRLWPSISAEPAAAAGDAAEAMAGDSLYSIHVASFQQPDRAQTLARQIEQDRHQVVFIVPAILPDKGLWLRVMMGAYRDRQEAQDVAQTYLLSKQFEFAQPRALSPAPGEWPVGWSADMLQNSPMTFSGGERDEQDL